MDWRIAIEGVLHSCQARFSLTQAVLTVSYRNPHQPIFIIMIVASTFSNPDALLCLAASTLHYLAVVQRQSCSATLSVLEYALQGSPQFDYTPDAHLSTTHPAPSFCRCTILLLSSLNLFTRHPSHWPKSAIDPQPISTLAVWPR